ncbi:kinase domain protein (macronuclear) [Tetrahymena thermophila SB210]|uniref:Kinase domain protein n=1 Tax=Tetrahymena thermophila (strain SB210) TaxID=312017 RepID=Q23DF5_TETTS|nr:kinase domain protein [Tetrahymena thermophila SB210]EAR94471.2 kinase domain protein [Tetrahymena thermophila SB210]|eukprot:XP_001014731.2 kinase domain protein [Tetrahymena thermophila SB210]
MIAHKFPGIQLDLSSVEVIWLHFTRFFMELEANFDSSMHVFKEPTGVYYKLTGNYSPKILEEAKQKTVNYVQKNKIEMLNTELEYKQYMNICQDLRQKFPKIYIQLLHYNVFDYVSKRLHQKFGYKQALQDYQELIKKKKRFCYLICDKAYFPQIKEAFYQLAEPYEKAAQQVSLRRTISTTSPPVSYQVYQQNPQTFPNHNRSNSTAIVQNINTSIIQQNQMNDEETNINNQEPSSSPRLTLGKKSNSYYEEDDYSYTNQGSMDQADFKGLDIQKEEFPCLSDAQILLNQQQASQLNDSQLSNSNSGSNIKSEVSKKKNNKKQKKKLQQQQIKLQQQQQQQQQLNQASSQALNSFLESYQKESISSDVQKSQSQQTIQTIQNYTKAEQFDEWDFELPTYKQTQSDPNLANKPLSLILQEEYPGYFNFQKPQTTNQKSGQNQLQNSEQKQKASSQQQSDPKSSNSTNKKEATSSQNSQQQILKKTSSQNSQQNQQQSNNQNITQQIQNPSQVKEKLNQQSQQQMNQKLFQSDQVKSSVQDKFERSQNTDSNSFDEVQQIIQQELNLANSASKSAENYQINIENKEPSTYQDHQQLPKQLHQQASQKSSNSDSAKKREDFITEQSQKELLINQTNFLLKLQNQSHPPGLPPPPQQSDDLQKTFLFEQNSQGSTQEQPQLSLNAKSSENQSTKLKNTELSEKQQKLMKSIKSEPFNPNKGTISIKLDSIIVEQDFKIEELAEKQIIFSDDCTETIKIIYKENQYCLKKFKNLSAFNLRRVNNYIENLRVLASPRIIRSFGKTVSYSKHTFDLFILLDFKERNLMQAIKEKLIISFNDKLSVLWQITQAIQQIHGNVAQDNMIHGNLKPENILLSSKKKVFLQDFYVLKNRENKYKPKNEGLTQAADIWSLGLITYFLFTDHLIDTEKAEYLISEQVLLNQIYKPGNSDIRVIYNLIERMLDSNPSNRPDIEEIVSHLKPIIQKKNKELNIGLNVQSSAFENIQHISQQNVSSIITN